ncbi:MAG: 23S rRNA (adenine(2030)-N(6))-methyltransferase RlmJ, partial [Gammaproteobacteria bacterium]|nr:23S rRNA (adenine(2030)-N(6))-methyltransferase RlmJ [Gammaproteobacteria bacterium]
GLRRAYPGSPVLVAGRLRSQARAVLFEADARECALLERALAHCRRCRVAQQDGYRALRSLLPPAERRCLVLIDPPYEDAAADRERIVATLGDALARCATGLYLIWYPLKRAAEGVRWLRQLTAVCDSARPHSRPWLASELWVHPLDSPVALNGSGLLLVNPPFQIEREWRAATAALAAALADVGGGWRLVP